MALNFNRITVLWPGLWRRARDVAGGAGICSFVQDIQFINDTYHSVLNHMPSVDVYVRPVAEAFSVYIGTYRAIFYPAFAYIPLHPPFIFCDLIVSLLVSLTIIDVWTRRKYRRIDADIAVQTKALEKDLPPELRLFNFEADGVKFHKNGIGLSTALKAVRDARSISKGRKTIGESAALQTMMIQMLTISAVSNSSSAINKMYLAIVTDTLAISSMFLTMLTVLEADLIYRVVVDATLSIRL